MLFTKNIEQLDCGALKIHRGNSHGAALGTVGSKPPPALESGVPTSARIANHLLALYLSQIWATILSETAKYWSMVLPLLPCSVRSFCIVAFGSEAEVAMASARSFISPEISSRARSYV